MAKDMKLRDAHYGLLEKLVVGGPTPAHTVEHDREYMELLDIGMISEIVGVGSNVLVAATRYGCAALTDYYQVADVKDIINTMEWVMELTKDQYAPIFTKFRDAASSADFKTVRQLAHAWGAVAAVEERHKKRAEEQQQAYRSFESFVRDLLKCHLPVPLMLSVSPAKYDYMRALEISLGREVHAERIPLTFTAEVASKNFPQMLEWLNKAGMIKDSVKDAMKRARYVDGAREVLADPNSHPDAIATANCTLANCHARADAPNGMPG